MGYYPNVAAKTLKTSHSSNLGILYEDRMNHEYFSSLIDDLRREADANSYDLTFLGRLDRSGNSYYEHARQRSLDGVIVLQADFDDPGIVRLASGSIPTVIIDHIYEGCDCVLSDNRTSIEQVIRHAWNLGHRRIAFIQGEKGTASRERVTGFYKICAELGIRVPVAYVRDGHFHDPVETTRIIHELLQLEEKPTCILCPDDSSCLGALWQLAAQGISVPDDVSLIGYDGIRMGQMMHPCLTTYRQDTARIAEAAFSLILEAITNPENHIPQQITVRGMLIEGETLR
jgi:DNA-binding LacI/PurR family transcriptional regulator